MICTLLWEGVFLRKSYYIYTILKMNIMMKKLFFSVVFAFTLAGSINAQNDTIIKAKVLDDGSQDAEKFYNAGIEDFKVRNFQGAIINFNQAITLRPDFERAYYNRGATKFEMKDYNGAIADFDKALTIVQGADSYFSRGQAKYALGNKVGAAEDYTKTVEIKSDYAQAFYYRGGIKFENKDYKAAIEDFTSV